MAGKSVRSGKLPYGKPRADIEPPTPSPVTLVDPIEYIRLWDKFNHGKPVDISKAKQMTRDDLMSADPCGLRLLLAYRVPWKQIAKQYNVPNGSMSKIFKAMGVNTCVERIVDLPTVEPAIPLAETVAKELPIEGTSDPAKIAEFFEEEEPVETPAVSPIDLSGFLTYNRSTVRQPTAEPFISVNKSGNIRLSRPIGESFKQEDQVTIKLHPGGHTIVLIHDPVNGLKFSHPGSSEVQGARRLSAKHLADHLRSKGVNLPVKYIASRQDGMWVGKLLS